MLKPKEIAAGMFVLAAGALFAALGIIPGAGVAKAAGPRSRSGVRQAIACRRLLFPAHPPDLLTCFA